MLARSPFKPHLQLLFSTPHLAVCWHLIRAVVTQEVEAELHVCEVQALQQRHAQSAGVEGERCLGVTDAEHGLLQVQGGAGGEGGRCECTGAASGLAQSAGVGVEGRQRPGVTDAEHGLLRAKQVEIEVSVREQLQHQGRCRAPVWK